MKIETQKNDKVRGRLNCVLICINHFVSLSFPVIQKDFKIKVVRTITVHSTCVGSLISDRKAIWLEPWLCVISQFQEYMDFAIFISIVSMLYS